jgi:two-component system, response regulator PdtaR
MATVPLQRLDTAPVRVLLVEDETFVRLDVAEILRQAGFEVIEAAKADAAMEFVDAGEQVDVVFTDVQTPGLLTGFALAERIRAKFPMVPIIITSGNTNIEDAASRLGKFLPKPYSPVGIPNLIAEIVGSMP